MTEEIIRQFVLKDIVKSKDLENIQFDTDLIGSGIIDSLGIQRLLVFLEDKFSIHISDDELVPDNFETIDKIALMINSKKKY